MPSDVGIWDLAISVNNQKIINGEESINKQKETSLIFVGSKSVGKTTLIHRFLEREEAPKQTLALEYTFGRKTNQNLIKDVCHLWELGGGTLYTNLIETPLSANKLPETTIVMVVDLAKPERIWNTLTTLISSIKEYIANSLKSEQAKTLKIEERLEKESALRLGPEHMDADSIQTFPIPLVIFGGKYDIFQDFEPEKKKLICRTLRFIAHLHGATLQFYSAKDPGLVKKARDLLSHSAFSSAAVKGMSQDYNKPLIIPAGSDTFQAILSGGEVPKLEVMKHQFSTHFPQEEGEALTMSEDPAKDPHFKEAEVDMLRLQKDEDLDRYRRDVERRQRSWNDIEME